MSLALIILGIIILLTTYRQSKADTSVFNEKTMKAFKTSIVGQFSISIILIICGIVFMVW